METFDENDKKILFWEEEGDYAFLPIFLNIQ